MPKLNKQARAFAAEQEETRAAATKARKKARRREWDDSFVAYLAERFVRLEANGNHAAATAFRDYWATRLKPRERKQFLKACGGPP